MCAGGGNRTVLFIASTVSFVQQYLQYTMQPQFSIKSPEFSVIESILDAVKEINLVLETPVVELQKFNTFGFQQLQQDLHSDEIVEKHLKKNEKIKAYISEEKAKLQQVGQGEGYIVSYDPIDGSNIIDVNFSVGSIFSIWPNTNEKLVGIKVKSLVNAVMAIYGPRTTAILYNPDVDKVQEITLINGKWILSRDVLQIKEKTNMFSPCNLRAVTENQPYRDIVNGWIDKGYTLRYTGGLVPDLTQILIKGHGVFAIAESKSHPARLRVLYEASAAGFLVHKAGGTSMTIGGIPLPEYEIKALDDKIPFAIGSSTEIASFEKVFDQN